MRSSARVRAAVGHGKNRDYAFDLLSSLNLINPSNARNQGFRMLFYCSLGIRIPSLQEMPHAHPKKAHLSG